MTCLASPREWDRKVDASPTGQMAEARRRRLWCSCRFSTEELLIITLGDAKSGRCKRWRRPPAPKSGPDDDDDNDDDDNDEGEEEEEEEIGFVAAVLARPPAPWSAERGGENEEEEDEDVTRTEAPAPAGTTNSGALCRSMSSSLFCFSRSLSSIFL